MRLLNPIFFIFYFFILSLIDTVTVYSLVQPRSRNINALKSYQEL